MLFSTFMAKSDTSGKGSAARCNKTRQICVYTLLKDTPAEREGERERAREREREGERDVCISNVCQGYDAVC